MSAPGERVWADAQDHVRTYLATDGAEGYRWHGRPHLLLTTTGRRSGLPRTVPLVFARLATADGERLVVAASAGGAESHPAWYLNLEADPSVSVRLREQAWGCVATTAEGATAEAAWEALGRTWDGFLAYRRSTRRRIPVVLLALP